MIDALSEKIAVKLKQYNEEETASVEVMKFGLAIVLSGLFTSLLCLTIGFFTGHFLDTIVTLLAFAFLRFFSGGFHFQSSIACTAATCVIVGAIPLVPVSGQMNLILTLASLALVALFAPSNISGATRMPEKYYPLLKIISIVIVASNLLLHNDLLALTFFVQSLLLIRLKREVRI